MYFSSLSSIFFCILTIHHLIHCDLGVLPSVLASISQSESAETKTVGSILSSDIGKDLILSSVLGSRAGNESVSTTVGEGEVSPLLAVAGWSVNESISEGSIGNKGRVSLSVSEFTFLGDIELLAAWNCNLHTGAGRFVNFGNDNDGGVILELVTGHHTTRAVGGGGAVDVEALAAGIDLAVVDWRGRADGHDGEWHWHGLARSGGWAGRSRGG